MTENPTLQRLANALLILAPIALLVGVFVGLPAFFEHTSLGRIQKQLMDVHDDRSLYLADLSFQFAAAVAIICAAASLSARLRDARALAIASFGFGVATAVLLVAAAGLKVALIDTADAVAAGDSSGSTLLLGRVLADAANMTLGMSMIGSGLWVGVTSAAMLRTGLFSRWAANTGVAAGALMLTGIFSDLSDAVFIFTGLGGLLMIVWAVWLAVATLRGGDAHAPAAARRPAIAPA